MADSPETVAAGHVQVESGVDWDTREVQITEEVSRNFSNFAVPTKLRFGVRDRLEVHALMNVFESTTVAVDPTDSQLPFETSTFGGVDDLNLGAKATVLTGSGAVPTLGVLASVTLPTATSDEISTNSTVLTAVLASQWSFPGAWGITTNAGIDVPTDDREMNTDVFNWAVLLSAQFTGISDRLGGFIEAYGAHTLDGDGRDPLLADGGITLRLGEDFQMDVYGKIGLNDDAQDWGLGAGFAARF